MNDGDLMTKRMASIDCCPRCLMNYESPETVRPLRKGFRATFWCRLCNHRWYTSYLDEDEG